MINLFSFEFYIDNQLFAGRIPAKSQDDAERLVPFAHNVARIVEEFDDNDVTWLLYKCHGRKAKVN